MNKRELLVETPHSVNIDPIYKISSYASGFDDDGILNKYNNIDIGVSKEEVANIDNTNAKAINPTELHAYEDIVNIKDLRYGFDALKEYTLDDGSVELRKYGLDELYLISTALKNNIIDRVTAYNNAEYFNKLKDWKKALYCIADSESHQTLVISECKSHLYVCEHMTNIFCNIRGVEFKYSAYEDKLLNMYFYVLPPDIFKYIDVYDAIDSVRIEHDYYRTDGEGNIVYPKVSYFDWKENTSEDITTELTTQINNMNLIK